MGRRTWIKLYCSNWLRGSISKETPLVRAVFTGLLAMAGDSAFGDIGEINIAEDVGLTDEQFARTLNVTPEEWATARAILERHPKGPEENRIVVTRLGIGIKILIINWQIYQGEYERQKKYRLQKTRRELLANPSLFDESSNLKLQTDASNLGLQGEGEGEGEREGEREKKEDGEEDARETRATASSPEFVSFSQKSIPEIIRIFKKNGFSEFAKNKRLVDFVSFLCFENPDFDHEDVIEAKLAHYRDNPPKKRANLCLAFKNWFRIERKIQEDRKRNAFSPTVGRRKK